MRKDRWRCERKAASLKASLCKGGCQPKADWRVVSLRNIRARRFRQLGNNPSGAPRQLPLHRGAFKRSCASSPCTGEPLNKEKNFKFLLTISGNFSIIKKLFGRYGGVAQLARALGSYPGCHWFKSNRRYHLRDAGQAASRIAFYGPVVKRLRHRPFTAVTRVRFSSGSPFLRRLSSAG